MHFRFDDDQLAMRDAVRAFCTDRFDLEAVATREGRPADARSWSGLAGFGIFDMLGADADAGIGVVEGALVFEELGAHLVSGPVLWTALAATVVPSATDGSTRVAGVEVPAWRHGPVVVAHGSEADALLVVKPDRAELCSVAVLAESQAGASIDPLTPCVLLPSVPEGEVVADGEALHRLRLDGRILAAAMLVGAAQGALDTARAYALERRQFGVAIGSFQAVKHILADMFVRVELARAALYAAAALSAGRGLGDPEEAASTAKLLAGDAGIANSRAAVQVLGGMGFTWDMLPHLFLKRSWLLEESFGTRSVHAARLGAAVGDEVGTP